MKTPICDFALHYAESSALRLHMPGHKGHSFLGMEALDITEIDGADSLYEADGIIRESEDNASVLFGCPTFYSTEGSSQCIRAMLHLTALHARQTGKRPLIAAGRNVHKAFLSAAALLDLDVLWLFPQEGESYLTCRPDADFLDAFLAEHKPTAVYLTSPDYLGHLADLDAIGRVCRAHGVLLLVDNAHGAYLRFLPESLHPIDQGAHICCDSAHKTLPVLTGGAYLHIAKDAPPLFSRQIKNALALFGSTSPSYLILQSLDYANRYIADGYKQRLAAFLPLVHRLKGALSCRGYPLVGDEPLKLTLSPKSFGYTGNDLARLLAAEDLICEFSDPDFLVFMLTPEIGTEGLCRLEDALLSVPQKAALTETPPPFCPPQRIMSIREATLSPCRTVCAAESLGQILAAPSVGCPPAVPITVCGERIDKAALRCFSYYGFKTCTVVESCEKAVPDGLTQ